MFVCSPSSPVRRQATANICVPNVWLSLQNAPWQSNTQKNTMNRAREKKNKNIRTTPSTYWLYRLYITTCLYAPILFVEFSYLNCLVYLGTAICPAGTWRVGGFYTTVGGGKVLWWHCWMVPFAAVRWFVVRLVWSTVVRLGRLGESTAIFTGMHTYSCSYPFGPVRRPDVKPDEMDFVDFRSHSSATAYSAKL